jgi:hypothetical protein
VTRAAATRAAVVPLLLRGVALVIAALAVLDPVLTSDRRSDAVVAVVAGSAAGDGALADEIARQLDGTFTVVRGPFPGAAASVVAGAAVPDERAGLAAPAFVVVPEPRSVQLARVHAPAAVPLDATTHITADVRSDRAQDVEVVLLRDGATVDRQVIRLDGPAAGRGSDDVATAVVALSFAPAEPGVARLRIEARAGDGAVVARDVVVNVLPRRWNVLFHDGRPSWQSTFVRRTLELDARFMTSARVVTSRDIATEFGAPQATLRDGSSLAAFDAIVVGAPETLSGAEVAGLEHYLRRRGGAVVLLLDRHADGAHHRLAGGARWAVSDATPGDVSDAAGTAMLRTGARAWPVALPAGARPLLLDGEGRPLLWRTAVGAGRVIVSGALDAWQFRDAESSRFEEFWPALIAEAAAASPPAISAAAMGVVRPGAWTDIEVTVRDATLAAATSSALRAAVSARIVGGDTDLDEGAGGDNGAARVVQLWPVGAPGTLRGEFRAPHTPGTYSIVIDGGDDILEVPLVVAADAAAAAPADAALLAVWARSRGGEALPASRRGELGGLLQQQIGAARAPRQWHPMRSPWWLLPFVAALAGEWWWRRRRGLP